MYSLVGIYIHQYVDVDFNLGLWTFLYVFASKSEMVGPYEDFKSGSVCPQNLSFISRVLFDNLDALNVHMNFKISLTFFTRMHMAILIMIYIDFL